MKEERTIQYREDIDGLRSLAVLLVLVFHFKLVPFGKGGFLGVDIFFVISGFLIASIILKQLNRNTFSFKEFYLRRIRRLAPALFSVLILVFITGSFVLLPSDFEELSKQLFATQLYFSNIYFWQSLDYFGLRSDSTLMLHTWSLAVEEQFYLIFPLVLFILYKHQKKFIPYWVLLGIIFSFFLNVYLVDKKPELTFYLMPTRAWEFLSGAAIIYFLNLKLIQSKGGADAIGVIGLLLIFYAVINYSVEVSFPGYYALIPVVGTMLIILSGSNISSLTYKIFSNSVAVYIGKISYSLYLVHWPVNVFASMSLGEDYSLSWRVYMLLLTFIISILLYHYIESPIRDGKMLKSKDRHYRYYFMGVSLSLVVFSLIVFNKGVPERFSKNAIHFSNFSYDKAPEKLTLCSYVDTKQTFLKDDFCTIGDSSSSPEWVIIGDSHALAASSAFGIWLKENKQSSYFMYRYSCPPLLGIGLFKSKGECFGYNQKSYEFILNDSSIKNVVLVSTWIQAKRGVLTSNSEIKLNREESITTFEKQFVESLDLLNANSKKVYLWSPVPGANSDVPKTLAKSKDLAKSIDELEITLEEHLDTFDFFYKVANLNHNKIYKQISPYIELCDSGYCKILDGNNPIYYDNAHIAYSSSNFWSKMLQRQLQ